MKWVFLAGLLIATCALIAVLKNDRRRLPAAAFCLGLLPFIEARFHLLAAPVSWPAWLGQSKGFEVSLADGVAFAILLATRGTRSPVLLKLAMGLVVSAYLVSTIATGSRTETLFVGWEIVRNLLVFFAVLRVITADQRALLALLTGMITGLSIQAVVVFPKWQVARFRPPAGSDIRTSWGSPATSAFTQPSLFSWVDIIGSVLAWPLSQG